MKEFSLAERMPNIGVQIWIQINSKAKEKNSGKELLVRVIDIDYSQANNPCTLVEEINPITPFIPTGRKLSLGGGTRVK